MDASLRFNTRNLTSVIESAKDLTVMAAEGDGSVAVRTHQNMFSFLGENPCTFTNLREFQAGFIIYYGNEFGEKMFMLPWISCALTFGCMVPDSTFANYLTCPRSSQKLHMCHRFEQSMMSILLYRLFQNAHEHTLKPEYYTFCRGCKT